MDLLLCEAFDGLIFWSKRQSFFNYLILITQTTTLHHVLVLTEELELGGLKVSASGSSWE